MICFSTCLCDQTWSRTETWNDRETLTWTWIEISIWSGTWISSPCASLGCATSTEIEIEIVLHLCPPRTA